MSKKESSNSLDNGSGKPRTIVAKRLDYKEKEEIIRRSYMLKDTGYYTRDDFSKETIPVRSKLRKEVQKLRQNGKYAILKYDNILSGEFRKKQ